MRPLLFEPLMRLEKHHRQVGDAQIIVAIMIKSVETKR